ncbi:hypothetical protein TNCV_998871 [Trichonephila clavipes]|nr:hypothetical protein TNCV_998871 [Trichonephila clavipes]
MAKPIRKQHLIQTVKQHPQKQMFWGYFTSGGPGSLVPVEGMMNSKQYISIIERKIMPMIQMFTGGVVVSDSDCCVVGHGFESVEGMGVCKGIVPLLHKDSIFV